MRLAEKTWVEIIWALVCYAGPAPEASIGSKPIGSELERNIGAKCSQSQGFQLICSRICDVVIGLCAFQAIDTKELFFGIVGLTHPATGPNS